MDQRNAVQMLQAPFTLGVVVSQAKDGSDSVRPHHYQEMKTIEAGWFVLGNIELCRAAVNGPDFVMGGGSFG